MRPARQRSGSPSDGRRSGAERSGLLALQRSVGNRAVATLVQRAVDAGTPVPRLETIVERRIAQSPGIAVASHVHAVEAWRETLRSQASVDECVEEQNRNARRLGPRSRLKPTDVEAVRREAGRVLEVAEQSANVRDRRFGNLKTAILRALHGGRPQASRRRRTLAAALAVRARIRASERVRLLARPEGARFREEPDQTVRQRWAAALRRLPGIERLRRLHAAEGLPARPNAWADGGKLENRIQEDPTDAAGNPVGWLWTFRTPIADGTFAQKVGRVDELLRAIVEHGVLSRISRPAIRVHPLHALGLFHPFGFRAHQSGEDVHVAADDSTAVIAHEVGHYLEAKGARGTWVDLQKLLHERHRAAGGGALQKTFYISKAEGRLGGTYAATGDYSSKFYPDGSTEVMSMTIEHLADASTFQLLLERDPKQAAIVLRGLQPAAYATEPSLREFDPFLPSV